MLIGGHRTASIQAAGPGIVTMPADERTLSPSCSQRLGEAPATNRRAPFVTTGSVPSNLECQRTVRLMGPLAWTPSSSPRLLLFTCRLLPLHSLRASPSMAALPASNSDRPGSPRRHRRAGHLPQRRDRFLRAAGQGARASRPRHRRRPRGHDLRRRMDHGLGRLGQRSHPWPAVQGALHAHLGAEFRRGHREVSLLRHDPRYWPGLRQEDGQGIRREGVRHHRSRA